MAFALLAGEAAAFAAPRFAAAWPWAAAVLALAVLARVGWNLRRGGLLLVFVLGGVLAARTDARLAAAAARRADNAPSTFELPVEGDVGLRARSAAKGGGVVASFPSHVGPLALRVFAAVPAGAEPPRPGEVWRCAGWLNQPPKGRNRYAARRFWAVVPGAAARVAAADPGSAAVRFRTLGDDLARRAGIGLGRKPETAALNRAILLGRRADLPRVRRRTFVDAGTVHVFAISGLHVMLVASLLALIAARLGLPFDRRGLLVIPLVAAYTALVGAPPSAVRAAVMATFYFAAPVLGRRPDSLAAWSATAILVYGFAPENFFNVGCALSFVVMLGIVVWCRWSARFPSFLAGLDRRIRLARANEDILPAKGRFAALCGRLRFAELGPSLMELRYHPRSAGLRLARRSAAWVLGSLAVSLAAWLAGVPIAAYVFGRFTPGGMLANLVVIPAAFIVVFSGVLGLAASYVWDVPAALLNNIAGWGTDLMSAASSVVAGLPGGHFDVAPWTLLDCAGWYAAVALLMIVADHLFAPRADDGLGWAAGTAEAPCQNRQTC